MNMKNPPRLGRSGGKYMDKNYCISHEERRRIIKEQFDSLLKLYETQSLSITEQIELAKTIEQLSRNLVLAG